MKRTGKVKNIETILPSDINGNILQVASYDTSSYSNVASGGNIAYTSNTIIRLAATDANAWISIGTDEGTGAGLFLANGSEITLLINSGDTLYVNDATVNVTEISE